MTETKIKRSIIIPVLDFSPHSSFNILTLLEELKTVPSEVICIFNSDAVFEKLKDHERIDKFSYNNLNAGVSRSWNLGINLSEGDSIFILNSDLHVEPGIFDALESYLFSLPDAVIVGPQGSHLDFKNLRIIRYFQKGNFDAPVKTHDISGFFFGIHRKRFLDHHLMFDVRYSPCFMEEWDMGVQVIKANLACYTVPVKGFHHDWGISQSKENTLIRYFNHSVYRNDILMKNREQFLEKWFPENSKEQG